MISVDLRQLPSAAEVYLCRDAGYFPVLINPRGQEILAVLRAGAGHVGITGRLDAVRSLDGGVTWGSPTVIVDTEVDDRNPAVGQAPDGTVVLAYHAQGSYNEDGSWARDLRRVQMRVTWSNDGGLTWETPQPLNYAPMEKYSAYGHIVNLPDGTMLLPIYGSRVGATEKTRDHAYILRSQDNGRTWEAPTLIAEGYNETALLPLPNGDLLAAFRSDDRGALLATSRSADGGMTWTEPAAVTGAREHPADLMLLSNGWVIMFFGVRHDPFGVQAYLSKDQGRTWAARLIVCDEVGDNDLGYPSTVRLGDQLVTAYYSAPRQWNEPNYRGEGAFARALRYSEKELLEALS
ncbi:MAG: sialidase family protein [Candidatus Poribacteria bacterium]|nr:sialidase family protein [Candidatus Poribacteria bacterium]